MASVEKRGSVYLVRWRHLGDSRSKTFKSHDTAQTFKRQVESDQAAGLGVDPRDGRVTLSAWAKDWHAGRIHLRASTREKNRHLANHYLAAFGKAQLAQITTADVQAWIPALDLKPSTVAEIHGELKKCLDAAVLARKIRINPCIGVNLPSKRHEEMRTLSREEVAKLANEIDNQYRSLIFFLAYSGLRIGEATALTPADVDLRRNAVRVNKASVEVAGHLQTQAPKTRAGLRTVPVPPSILAMLDLSRPTVFNTRAGHPVRVNAWRSRFFRPAAEAAGLAVRIHDLRHTAVSMWIDEGFDLVRLKTWAGHTSSTFTVDRYGHLFHNDHTGLMSALDEKVVL